VSSISIPSGAIKSQRSKIIELSGSGISIPSGAIKSTRQKNILNFGGNFNSFWCD